MREIGAQLFGDLRRQAESVISAKINDELDTKLRHKFDWSMVEARGITRYLVQKISSKVAVFLHFRTIDTFRLIVIFRSFAIFRSNDFLFPG